MTAPAASGVRTTVTMVEARAAISSSRQTIVPSIFEHEPLCAVAAKMGSGGLKRFENITPEAIAGPALLTVMFTTRLLPTATGLTAARAETCRSEIGSTVARER